MSNEPNTGLKCAFLIHQCFLWIDEIGFNNRNLLRKYGYGLRGQPPQDHTLVLRGKRYSAIAVLSSEGVEDVHVTNDSVNGEVFLEFVHKYMLPIVMQFNAINPTQW